MIKRKANYFHSVLYELNLFHFKVRVEAQVEEFNIGKKQLISIHISKRFT
jgi:hypothetical protein